MLECLSQLKPAEDIQEVTLEVSERAAMLGKNPYPANMYEGFVSLPFITARALLNPAGLYQPLSEVIELSQEEKALIAMIRIIPVSSYADDMAKVTVSGRDGTAAVFCSEPSGSSKKPMTAEQVIHKAETLGLSWELIHCLTDPKISPKNMIVFRGSGLTIE